MRFWKKYHTAFALKKTPLCIGLDTAFENLPIHLQSKSVSEAIIEFNKCIIAATSDVCIAYKINLAFYEQYGIEGWRAFEATLKAIPDECITIADAKRGDIGNTSKAYATTFFDRYNCDSVTVAPYMGQDSVAPFLEFTDRMTFILALTSNAGSHDFQRLQTGNKPLYKTVIQTSLAWSHADTDSQLNKQSNCGFVVGATHPQELADIRTMIPDVMLLIPGIGAQGGDVAATIAANKRSPALINVSRAIIYASAESDFDIAARNSALRFNADVRNAES